MTVKEFQDRVFAFAKAKGWTENEVSVPEQVALIHSEASEALESWRKHEPNLWIGEGGKPEGIASEYADIVVRVAHYCSLLGIDLETELIRKMDFNDTRPYRHGGKRA